MAVTEAMHYFFGRDCNTPHDQTRYQAVKGPHIACILRDTLADVTAGYYYILWEEVDAGGITPLQVESQI